MASRKRHAVAPKRTEDLLRFVRTDHAMRMANLTYFQRGQTFGFCTGSLLGKCDQGINGNPLLLTPFNGN
jgi:hypothetical protein